MIKQNTLILIMTRFQKQEFSVSGKLFGETVPNITGFGGAHDSHKLYLISMKMCQFQVIER